MEMIKNVVHELKYIAERDKFIENSSVEKCVASFPHSWYKKLVFLLLQGLEACSDGKYETVRCLNFFFRKKVFGRRETFDAVKQRTGVSV
jgi:hypothetical protein